jgi:phosphatidate phosphatase APP1
MGTWKDCFHHLLLQIETQADRAKNRLKRPYLRDELMIFPYLGYGTTKTFYLKGRVLEDKGIGDPQDDASIWANLFNTYKRFDSDEVSQARIRLRFQDQQLEVITDQEGYFDVRLQLDSPLQQPSYLQHVELELLSPLPPHPPETPTTATVIVPPEQAQFGVISDIDDTVLQTGATSLLAMVKQTLFGNTRTRLPFEGVAAFYTALHRDQNPIFYVSSSPWNLYDVLVDFLDIHDIPLGPLMLRDWGLTEIELLPTSHGDHKRASIEAILNTYPDLPFILIGDSGQEDPEIYREIVKAFPERILSIFIRDVSLEHKRDLVVNELSQEVIRDGSCLFIVQDTIEAAKQAAACGWIEPYWVEAVREKKAEDEAQPML